MQLSYSYLLELHLNENKKYDPKPYSNNKNEYFSVYNLYNKKTSTEFFIDNYNRPRTLILLINKSFKQNVVVNEEPVTIYTQLRTQFIDNISKHAHVIRIY